MKRNGRHSFGEHCLQASSGTHGTRAIGLVAAVLLTPSFARADALDRMQLQNLKATHEAVELLKEDRQPVPITSEYTDYRACVHVHTHLSHDSESPIEEIIAGAQEAGVKVLIFSDHPAPEYDFVTDSYRGMRDGVLMLPGAESKGLLLAPMKSIPDWKDRSSQELATISTSEDGGLAFLSHLEERMDWELENLTGTEIYNTHADFKDEPRFIQTLRNPLQLLVQITPAIQQYPQETYSALLDYPADYLKRWDELNQTRRHTGVAANDAHHNNAMKLILQDTGLLKLEDALGEELAMLDPEKITALKAFTVGKKTGDVVFSLDLDPYPRAFRHVTTHLLMKEHTEEAVRDALKNSRAYVSFDWMCDPTGFVFQAVDGGSVQPIGSEVAFREGLTLRAGAPLAGTFRLMRNGSEIKSERGQTFEYAVSEPGNYRVEVWLNVAGEPKIWILSNQIYVRGSWRSIASRTDSRDATTGRISAFRMNRS